MQRTIGADGGGSVTDRATRRTGRRLAGCALASAEAACDAGPGGWLYRFDLEPTGELGATLGVTHAPDLGFVFDTVEAQEGPSLHDDTNEDVRALATYWSKTLTSFARHGHPYETAPGWNPYLPDRACLIVDQHPRTEIDLDADRQVMWGDRPAMG